MRAVLLILFLGLAACGPMSYTNRVDERTFRIEDTGVAGGAEGPNRRAAQRLCPSGYRVLDSREHKGGPDRATTETDTITVWTIRCL